MLTKRIDAIVAITQKSAVAADIGCDHGYTAIQLILTHKASHVLACDTNPLPLAKSIASIRHSHLEDRITTYLSDGFYAIRDIPFDTAVLSGMGGRLVIKILQDNMAVTKRLRQLILQPQHDLYAVRQRLYEIGFVITDEELVKEAGMFYPIIRAEPGTAQISDAFAYEFGPVLLQKKSGLFLAYLQARLTKNKSILAGLPEALTPQAAEKKTRLQKEIQFIEGVL